MQDKDKSEKKEKKDKEKDKEKNQTWVWAFVTIGDCKSYHFAQHDKSVTDLTEGNRQVLYVFSGH